MRPGCSQHQVKSGATGGTRLESEPQVHRPRMSTRAELGTWNQDCTHGTCYFGPSDRLGTSPPISQLWLRSRGPVVRKALSPWPEEPPAPLHFPHWRRENILPRCRQPDPPQPPPAPSQDLAQRLGLSQGFSQTKGEMTGCSALPCPRRSPTSPSARPLPGCPCLYCQDSASNSSGLSSPSWPLH